MEVFVFIVIFAWIINMCWLPIYFSEKHKDMNWLFANDCEIACQFNKSNCDDFIRCVLSTYFKINCKV